MWWNMKEGNYSEAWDKNSSILSSLHSVDENLSSHKHTTTSFYTIIKRNHSQLASYNAPSIHVTTFKTLVMRCMTLEMNSVRDWINHTMMKMLCEIADLSCCYSDYKMRDTRGRYKKTKFKMSNIWSKVTYTAISYLYIYEW